MSFQNEIRYQQALGVAGQISKAFHNYANTISGMASDDNVCVGCFVQSKANGTYENEVIG